MNVIILLSRNDQNSSRFKARIKNTAGVEKYVIGLLNADLENVGEDIKKFIEANTAADVQVLPFSRFLSEHSIKIKDDYIRFISELGGRLLPSGKSLKEHFQFKASSLWWVSMVYEKSPPKTDSFLHFVKVSLTIHLAQQYKCEEIWLSCEGENIKIFNVLSGIADFKIRAIGPRKKRGNFLLFLREWARAARHIVFILMIYLRMKWQTRGQPARKFPEECRRFMLTMFPFFDRGKFDQKKFYSKAYGPLQDGLDQDQDYPYVWLALHLKIEPYTWWSGLPVAKEIKTFTPNFFSIDEWLRFKDVFHLIGEFVFFNVRCLTVLDQVPPIASTVLPGGVKVCLWDLIREEFVSSFAGKALIVNLHYLAMFFNIVKDLPPGASLVHFAEMQMWERDLQIACLSREDIKVIALQHAHMPQLLLNYYDDPLDLKRGDCVHQVPQPSYLGMMGTVAYDYFLRQGWDRSKLFIVGGFRFQSLLRDGEIPPSPQPSLVAAFSINYNESVEMLRMLHRAFNDGLAKIRVYIKSHPAESIERMAAKNRIDLNPEVFVFTSEPLEKLIPSATAMFACSTSSIFYAMNCHRPVIVPKLYDAIDLCPLTNVYPYEIRVENHLELKKVTGDIIQGHYNQNHFDRLKRKLISEYLYLEQDPQQPFTTLKAYLDK